MSDRGAPKSYRHMNGYGSHTFSLINRDNERCWVKFHFKTMQGVQCLTNADVEGIIGADRESHQRDLHDAIERGRPPTLARLRADHAGAGCGENAVQPLRPD